MLTLTQPGGAVQGAPGYIGLNLEARDVKLLLVEDDRETADFIAEGLSNEGHELRVVADGRDALLCATADPWDMLIVDRMLPSLDGLSLVRALRARAQSTPVLFLTTMAGIDDRVTGLNAGGDDYLVKPFAFAELVARVNALLRRQNHAPPATHLRLADLELDLFARRVHRSGRAVELQPREFQLLEYLMRHAGQVVTRAMLLERVWEFQFDPHSNIVDSHISRLRAKLDCGGPDLIHTVRGAGYTIRAPA